jgi:hypothetical protein
VNFGRAFNGGFHGQARPGLTRLLARGRPGPGGVGQGGLPGKGPEGTQSRRMWSWDQDGLFGHSSFETGCAVNRRLEAA